MSWQDSYIEEGVLYNLGFEVRLWVGMIYFCAPKWDMDIVQVSLENAKS